MLSTRLWYSSSSCTQLYLIQSITLDWLGATSDMKCIFCNFVRKVYSPYQMIDTNTKRVCFVLPWYQLHGAVHSSKVLSDDPEISWSLLPAWRVDFLPYFPCIILHVSYCFLENSATVNLCTRILQAVSRAFRSKAVDIKSAIESRESVGGHMCLARYWWTSHTEDIYRQYSD